ncbi:MAG: type II CRISPR RNA-guided endonuclease Cas9 [Bacteroidota bacterium]
MGKILGLDLGTNSIGWAVRDTDTLEHNQIVDYGVTIFEAGMGMNKNGEFSRAAERRSNRSKRRLYNAKRYRKWATLKVLMENNMCPITEEELRLWSIGNWQDGKNKGRVYPSSPDFIAWLAMDFESIGKEKDENTKLKPAFENTYLLRSSLLENIDETDKNRLFKIGRACYHLVQRRGFKTSRKGGKSGYAKNEELEKLKVEKPSIQISQILQNKLEIENKRIRASGVIQRKYFEDEFFAICEKQKIASQSTDKIYKAIYFVRPLRTQKGLVGTCTLEKGKTRIPISHPAFEEFRALSFINNIQWRETGSKNTFETIPMELKKKIFEFLFFKRNKKTGLVLDRTYFKFDDIIDEYSENGKREFNFRNKPNISTCPMIAGLINVFDDEWKDKFITDENKFGINWDGLYLSYEVKYGKKLGQKRNLNYEAIWHLLFDLIQTKDKEDTDIEKFCSEVFGWNEDKIKLFIKIDIQQGYGSLSKSAIDKINPFLKQGFIYSEAVSFANLSKVLGKEAFESNKTSITKCIANIIKEVDSKKEKLNIVNGLVQQFFAEFSTNRAKGVDNEIKSLAADEVEKKLKNYFGESNWVANPTTIKNEYSDFILEKYLLFLEGKQDKAEKASANQTTNPEIDYYKLPRLDEAIKQALQIKFNATDQGLKKLYHPSDIDIYPKAKYKRLEDPNPPSKGWKNPMAMRAMYELRKLVNYLLEVGTIDIDTKIVVEMARELNDANKRWAIQVYQRNREDENKEFAKAIIGVAKVKYPNLNENDADNINKVRLWWEQLDNGADLYKEVKALKEDVQKYRLWKEQQCQCFYTGKMIGITDLFDGVSYDFEHTLPIKDSFDNSLANLTICDAHYNREVKKKQMPTQLKNYTVDWNGYPAIEPKFKKWKDKVESLRKLIDDNKIRTKKIQDIAAKNDSIRKRHLLQFELDYWDKKVKTFTLKEIPNWWKNSQLVDTQIITKYARAYMKTVFSKVDVQKGSITADFRKIYGIMGDEKKDRSKHSHHAKDAAILTLIPGSAKREDILKKYYSDTRNFRTIPYGEFAISHIQNIEETVLINHVKKDQTLTETKKKVRKRGKIVYLRDEKTKQLLKDKEGKNIPMIMQGDSIRGGLHKDSYFGAIKISERNESGYVLKENGKYILKQKDEADEIWIVKRKSINEINIDKDIVIDELLKKHIKKQIEDGSRIEEVVDFNGKSIRHLRCRVKAGVGFLSKEKAMPIKKHIFASKHEHKKEYLVQNEENYLFLMYEGENKKEEVIRGYKILNLFEIAKLGISSIDEIKKEPEFQKLQKGSGKNIVELKLKTIIKAGDKVIFYKEIKEELQELKLQELNNRVFKVLKFNELGPTTAYLYLQSHIEARPDGELEKGEKELIFDKYQPRLELTCDKLNCAIENVDFNIHSDGKIKWLF